LEVWVKISWGMTRFVILFGSYSVKIARMRPIWMLRRLFRHAKTGTVRSTLQKNDLTPFQATLKYLSAGLVANLTELWLWRNCKEEWMVETIWSCGVVNIQRRGEKITLRELEREHPFRSELYGMPDYMIIDLSSPKNFCRINGRVLLCDYAGKGMREWLKHKHAQRTAILVA
jgi:hypothetical protein